MIESYLVRSSGFSHIAVAIMYQRAVQLLSDLVSIETVNPMGSRYCGNAPVERPAIEYLEAIFAPYDVALERQACGDCHENLLITVRGRSTRPGLLLESHVDTVPAHDWPTEAFRPRVENNVLFGRGACDDKGSLTAMVLATLDVLESGVTPDQTVWLLAAGDEEYSQTGIKTFLSTHAASIGRAMVGEPTNCVPVIQHKGMIRWDITVRGRSAHTSHPSLGRNAILDMIRVCDRLQQLEAKLQNDFSNDLTGGPTLTITMIQGGRTRNSVPDECTIAVDLRTLPGTDGAAIIDGIFADLQKLDVELVHQPFQCFAPGLNTPTDHPFVTQTTSICRSVLSKAITPRGAAYGTDAAWIPPTVPTIVLGPGDISVAHAVNERIEVGQVIQCAGIYKEIMLHAWS